MSNHYSILLSFALLGLVGGSTAQAASPAREAQRTFREASRLAEEGAKECFRVVLREFRQTLRDLRLALVSGEISPGQAIQEANAAAARYSLDLDQHASAAASSLAAVGTALLSDLETVPNGFRAGDCGTWDHFVETINGLYAQFGRKGAGKLKSLVRRLREILNAGGEIRIDINVRIVIVLPPPPAPPGPIAPPPPAVKIKSISSAHDARIAGDGKMSVRGSGPRNGVVQVNIQGPNGVNITRNVPTDGDGSFRVGFPSVPGDGNPGNLPEGNYRVTVSSGGQTATQFHGI